MLSSSIHSEKENLPLCKYCQKSFANHSNLRHHIQIIHLKENKWDCCKCGKTCSSKSNLKVHFRTHIRVKPYACKHCDYDCMHHSSIKDHLIRNHPEKPHTTSEPGYLYNSQAVPEPDEFNSISFDQEKFIESQKQSNNSLINSEQCLNPPNFSYSLLSLWPLSLYYSSYIPNINNTIHLSSTRHHMHQKSFDIDTILDLSLSNRKRKRSSTDNNIN